MQWPFPLEKPKPENNFQCPLLRLPYELRLHIYELLLTSNDQGRAINIYWWRPRFRGFMRLVGVLNPFPSDAQKARLASMEPPLDYFERALEEEFPSGMHNAPVKVKISPLVYNVRMGDDSERAVRHLDVALLRTCRQVYHEAGPLLYSLNTFSVTSMDDLSALTSRISPVTAAGLHTLSVVITVAGPNNISQSRQDIRHSRKRLAHLKNLYVILQFTKEWREEMHEIEMSLLDVFQGLPAERARVGVMGDRALREQQDDPDAPLPIAHSIKLQRKAAWTRYAWTRELERKLMQPRPTELDSEDQLCSWTGSLVLRATMMAARLY